MILNDFQISIGIITAILLTNAYVYSYAFKRTTSAHFRFRTADSLDLGIDSYASSFVLMIYIFVSYKFCEVVELVVRIKITLFRIM